MLSGCIGSVPFYGENIGYGGYESLQCVIAGVSIVCSFIGKLSTLISTSGPVSAGSFCSTVALGFASWWIPKWITAIPESGADLRHGW